jgi:hypothetical protein
MLPLAIAAAVQGGVPLPTISGGTAAQTDATQASETEVHSHVSRGSGSSGGNSTESSPRPLRTAALARASFIEASLRRSRRSAVVSRMRAEHDEEDTSAARRGKGLRRAASSSDALVMPSRRRPAVSTHARWGALRPLQGSSGVAGADIAAAAEARGGAPSDIPTRLRVVLVALPRRLGGADGRAALVMAAQVGAEAHWRCHGAQCVGEEQRITGLSAYTVMRSIPRCSARVGLFPSCCLDVAGCVRLACCSGKLDLPQALMVLEKAMH